MVLIYRMRSRKGEFLSPFFFTVTKYIYKYLFLALKLLKYITAAVKGQITIKKSVDSQLCIAN